MRIILVPIIISFLASMGLTQGTKPPQPCWLAKVTMKCVNKRSYSCPGAIISDTYLLTTASCISSCSGSVKFMKIFANQHSNGTCTRPFNKRLKVTGIMIHPDYKMSNETKDNNIALVKFKCPNFNLSKVSPNINCSDINKGVLSCINPQVAVRSPTTIIMQCKKPKNRKVCKNGYKDLFIKPHACIVAPLCSSKTDVLIANDKHSILYGISLHTSWCGKNKRNTIMAALQICKYYDWITNQTTGE